MADIQSETLPFPILIGDIGGTNARFSILADAEAKAIGQAAVAAVEADAAPSDPNKKIEAAGSLPPVLVLPIGSSLRLPASMRAAKIESWPRFDI